MGSQSSKDMQKNFSIANSLYLNKYIRDNSVTNYEYSFSDENFKEELPLVYEFAEVFGGFSLKNYWLLVSNHLLKDVLILLHVLINEFELNPRNVLFLGKPYSTNMRVAQSLKCMGVYVHPMSYIMDGKLPLKAARRVVIREMADYLFSRLKEQRGQKLLILDDGGEILKEIHHPKYRSYLSRVVGVEQTSRGFVELETVNLTIPIVNVARSKAKLKKESPFIGKLIFEKSLKYIAALTRDLSSLNILILGGGAIGSAVANEFSNKGFSTLVYDPYLECEHYQFSLTRNFKEALNSADVIIGCTGRVSLDEKQWGELKDSVILISASSSDLEFESWKIRSLYTESSQGYWESTFIDEYGFRHATVVNGQNVFVGSLCDPSHYLYKVRLPSNKNVYLVNGGCPINFSGSAVSMPLEESQFTVGLVFAGIVQSVSFFDLAEGWHELDCAMQEFIIKQHLKLTSSQGAAQDGT